MVKDSHRGGDRRGSQHFGKPKRKSEEGRKHSPSNAVQGSRPGRALVAPRGLSAESRYAGSGDAPLSVGFKLTLQEPFRFDAELGKRLRRREVNPKEAFTVQDSAGEYFRASLKELSANGGSALPYEKMARSPESHIELTLACAVLARQRMIFVMQKATELGVARVVPLLTDHSVPVEGLEHEKASSWPAQVIRATKQCRRSSLAEVLPPTSLGTFIESEIFKSADVSVVLDDRTEPTQVPVNPPRRVVLLVGPEGGFSDAERAVLATCARPWVLGGRILRAETAAIVGLAAVQMRWGDFA